MYQIEYSNKRDILINIKINYKIVFIVLINQIIHNTNQINFKRFELSQVESSTMSINIQKVIQTYGHILSLLQAKQNLYSDNSELNGFLQNMSRKKFQDKNWCVDFIESGILRLMRIWKKKFDIYELLADAHKNRYAQIQFLADNLKNNNEILSKQDQMIAELLTKIREWKQNMYPVDYYNIKQRRNLKQEIEQKLTTIKNHSYISNKTNAPLYDRKTQNEFKQSVLSIYYDQSRSDAQMVNFTLKMHSDLVDHLGKLDQDIDNADVPYFISPDSNQFNSIAYEILSRNSKPTNYKIANYIELLGKQIKKNQSFWNFIRINLQQFIMTINQILLIISKMKANFEEKEEKIYKLLAKYIQNQHYLQFYKVNQHILSNHQNVYIQQISLIYMKQKFVKRKDYCMKMEMECKNFISRLIRQQSQRNSNLHEFIVHDRRFFQEQAKSEKMIMRSLLQTFKQFLQETYNLVKESRKKMQKQCKFQTLQTHQLSLPLTKLIVDSENFESNHIQDNLATNCKQNKKSNESIQKIQEFQKTIYVFDSHKQIEQSMTKFTCALGPKLLLHGKLYIHSEGLYFQSQFNKKNILFGKTKLFIPKSQIIDIDMKNTLLVFPDAVVIKTGHGLVSFHALGQQKLIRQAIQAAYNRKTQICDTISSNNFVQFKKFNESKRRDKEQYDKFTQPLEMKIAQTTFEGSKLGQIFRRYFSDDKFQIGGTTYSNFKSYFLLQIQALNPQSNSITPPPPTYFSYQNEDGPHDHYPLISQRTHRYIKILPKIPFVSKGGQGQCQETQSYHWFSPDLIVCDILSIVRGFSLTEGMKIQIRTVLREIGQTVKMSVTAQIRFQKESSTNGLVKSPAYSNLKQSYAKMIDIMRKCEKSYSQNNNKAASTKSQIYNELAINQMHQNALCTNNQKKQFQISKKSLQLILLALILFYIASLFLIKLV